VDADTRNVQLQATVANPEEKLHPGMFVNGGSPSRPEKVVAIPARPFSTPYGDSVFIVEEDKQGKGGKVSQQSSARRAAR